MERSNLPNITINDLLELMNQYNDSINDCTAIAASCCDKVDIIYQGTMEISSFVHELGEESQQLNREVVQLEAALITQQEAVNNYVFQKKILNKIGKLLRDFLACFCLGEYRNVE